MSLRGAGHDRYFAFEIAHRLLLFRWRTERPAHYARLLFGTTKGMSLKSSRLASAAGSAKSSCLE
jgi:hypothetical protein